MYPLSGSIAVLGLGRSGRATAHYLADRIAAGDPIEVTAYDSADSEELRLYSPALEEAGIRVVLGASAVEGAVDLAIASPGIPPASPLRRSAQDVAEELIGEIEFAFRRSRSPWLAVTGTNGKTTVTSLVAHLMSEAGIPNVCVGNIGDPAIEAVDGAGPSTAIVAEVSSFQLALSKDFHPRVSVLLNITPDHIDWHGSLDAYAADKGRVFERQDADDTAIIDIDDPGSAPYAAQVAGRGVRVVPVSLERMPEGGAALVAGELRLDTPSGQITLLSTEELRIRGAHNVSNALAAAAAVYAWGVPPEDIAAGLKTFAPIEHRLQTVGFVDGVEYVDDSKATNPAAAIKALSAFEERGIVLLAGGRNKGSTFESLADAARVCRSVVVFGEAGPEIAESMNQAGVPVVAEGDMHSAIVAARKIATEGDVVLLSPACASFDEFSGYAERGRAFAHAVAGMR